MARIRSPQITRIPLPHDFPAWGVDVFESHHADDWRMDLTRHDFLKLVYALQGAGSLVTANGQRQPIQRGDLVIVPIGSEHRLEDAPGQPMSLYVVSVRPEVLRIASLDPARLLSGTVRLDEAASSRVESTLRRLLFEQTLEPAVAGAKVVGLILRTLAEFVRSERPDGARDLGTRNGHGELRDSSARMKSYVEDLQERFFEATSLDAAALALGLSRRRFTQLFREVTQSSWLNFVRRLRVEHAKHLLAQTDRTVLSIAFECGFEDLSTFYRAFKREAGSSPNQFRCGESLEAPSAGADPPGQDRAGMAAPGTREAVASHRGRAAAQEALESGA